MGFGQFKAQVLAAGKTVPFVLDVLVGKPVVHIEHLGDENVTWMNDRIARANSAAMAGRSAKRKISKATERADFEQRKEWVIKHVIRDLEAIHQDGTKATKADIPQFVEDIPPDVVDTIFTQAVNAENFREYPDLDVVELAGK